MHGFGRRNAKTTEKAMSFGNNIQSALSPQKNKRINNCEKITNSFFAATGRMRTIVPKVRGSKTALTYTPSLRVLSYEQVTA